MQETPRNRLVAAETLGFYCRAILYDRLYFWSLAADDFDPGFNLIVNKLLHAAKDLGDRLDPHTLRELRRLLETIQEEWNRRFGTPEHRALVEEYLRLSRGSFPTFGTRKERGLEDGPPDVPIRCDPVELVYERLIRSAPADTLARELKVHAKRCRSELPEREGLAFDLGDAFAREWNDRRYRFPAPLADWCYDEFETLTWEGPEGDALVAKVRSQSVVELVRTVAGLADRVADNYDIFRYRFVYRERLAALGRPRLILDTLGNARLWDHEFRLGEPARKLLRAVLAGGGTTVSHRRLAQEVGDHQKAKSLLETSLKEAANQARRSDSAPTDLPEWVKNVVVNIRAEGYRLGVSPGEIQVDYDTPSSDS